MGDDAGAGQPESEQQGHPAAPRPDRPDPVRGAERRQPPLDARLRVPRADAGGRRYATRRGASRRGDPDGPGWHRPTRQRRRGQDRRAARPPRALLGGAADARGGRRVPDKEQPAHEPHAGRRRGGTARRRRDCVPAESPRGEAAGTEEDVRQQGLGRARRHGAQRGQHARGAARHVADACGGGRARGAADAVAVVTQQPPARHEEGRRRVAARRRRRVRRSAAALPDGPRLRRAGRAVPVDHRPVAARVPDQQVERCAARPRGAIVSQLLTS